MTTSTTHKPETHQYQAEMQKLLDILVHSLYTEREIFLRELVSNASDALGKVQFTALTTQNIVDKDAALEIKVSFDEDANTLLVEDTGCGMSKEELIGTLGTIASSGTLKFLKEAQLEQQRVENLIGQFGVGFYAVFMVADKVELNTRSWNPEESAWTWTSEGAGEYTIEESDRTQRGTSIKLHLKEEAKEFCAEHRLKTIIKKYSNYLPFPVVIKEETVNQVNAIWCSSKSELEDKDYHEFYKQISHDFKAPMHHLHLSIDAPIQYYALLYLPEEISNEVLYARDGKGIGLYAQKVMIQTECTELLPPYLRFVRGVVDSEDLPLNVSRESVQHNALIGRIKKSLTNRVLRELKSIANSNTDLYQKFWKQYGNLIKEGLSDFANKEKIMDLLRFNSSTLDDAATTVSLKDYVGRMREEQKEIYYVTAPSREAILHHPNLEYFKKNGFEVLFFLDQIDDFMAGDLREYDKKTFKNISEADISIDEADETTHPLSDTEKDSLIDTFKKQLGDRVADVLPSKRLVNSPCSLVTPKESMGGHMEKMMKMANKDYQFSKRNLELNLNHAIVKNIAELIQKGNNASFVNMAVDQLFNNALLVEGLLENPMELLPGMYQCLEEASSYHLQK